VTETLASAATNGVRPLAAETPMARVADLPRSRAWYAKLGFAAEQVWTPVGRPTEWAHVRKAGAQLMLVRSDRPRNPGAQDVLFYLYAEGVAAGREKLLGEGWPPGALGNPVYAEHGELRMEDPDGYGLLVGDTEQQ
jgi:catechol 2,3-dioxygenase-like lactoylglutathione lyase family enzyme